MHCIMGTLCAKCFNWALSLDTLSRKLDAQRCLIEIDFMSLFEQALVYSDTTRQNISWPYFTIRHHLSRHPHSQPLG